MKGKIAMPSKFGRLRDLFIKKSDKKVKREEKVKDGNGMKSSKSSVSEHSAKHAAYIGMGISPHQGESSSTKPERPKPSSDSDSLLEGEPSQGQVPAQTPFPEATGLQNVKGKGTDQGQDPSKADDSSKRPRRLTQEDFELISAYRRKLPAQEREAFIERLPKATKIQWVNYTFRAVIQKSLEAGLIEEENCKGFLDVIKDVEYKQLKDQKLTDEQAKSYKNVRETLNALRPSLNDYFS
jgi:hypothetical protein